MRRAAEHYTHTHPDPERRRARAPDQISLTSRRLPSSRIPDPGDPAKPLATLVETKALTADEVARQLREDASFAALEADAVARGFGKIASATDLVYDNGVTVTVAPLGTCSGDVLRFAYRSSKPKAHYLLAELDQVAGRLTTYDENGTMSIDLTTGKSSAVESPTAHHSCSFLHCFNTAMEVANSAPAYGWLSEKICKGCAEAVANAWILGTAVGDALLGVPCVACLATMTAALSASVWVCLDDPCELCMSDACGQSDLGSDPPTFCVEGIASPDPETGSTAGRYWLEQRYHCLGITTNREWWLFGRRGPGLPGDPVRSEVAERPSGRTLQVRVRHTCAERLPEPHVPARTVGVRPEHLRGHNHLRNPDLPATFGRDRDRHAAEGRLRL